MVKRLLFPEEGALRWRFWALAGLAYFALWGLVNWPALHSAWWYQDEYWMMEQPVAGVMNLANGAGRPVTAGLLLLHFLMRHPDQELGNLAVRWFQGLLHAGTALAAATFFARYVTRWQAAVAALPFLLWAFAGEATLWFGGIQHVAGALLAILGLHLLVHGAHTGRVGWSAAGALGVASAVWANQAPVMVAPFLWAVSWVFRLWQREPFVPNHPFMGHGFTFEALGRKLDSLLDREALRRARRELTWLLVGLLLGAALSGWMMHRAGYHRAQTPPDWTDKLRFLGDLTEKLLFWPGFYPLWLQVTSALLVVAALGGLAWAFLRHRLSGFTAAACLLSLAGGLAVLFLANLVIAMNWPSFRVFYVSPLFFGALFLYGCAFLGQRPIPNALLTGLLLLLCAGFARLAWKNAADYPALYRADRRLVAEVEALARNRGSPRVLPLMWPHCSGTINWNPHGLNFSHLDAHRSEFHTEWSASPCLRAHSDYLKPEPDSLRPRYGDFARSLPQGPPWFDLIPAPDDPGLLLIIPR